MLMLFISLSLRYTQISSIHLFRFFLQGSDQRRSIFLLDLQVYLSSSRVPSFFQEPKLRLVASPSFASFLFSCAGDKSRYKSNWLQNSPQLLAYLILQCIVISQTVKKVVKRILIKSFKGQFIKYT